MSKNYLRAIFAHEVGRRELYFIENLILILQLTYRTKIIKENFRQDMNLETESLIRNTSFR